MIHSLVSDSTDRQLNSGFGDPSYFNRQFKRFSGVAPREYTPGSEGTDSAVVCYDTVRDQENYMNVDLTSPPYSLTRPQIEWVERTRSAMTEHEAIAQLFVHFFRDTDAGKACSFLEKYPVSAIRYAPVTPEAIGDLIGAANESSRFPLLVAGNADCGGNGLATGGTFVASPAQAEATGDQPR